MIVVIQLNVIFLFVDIVVLLKKLDVVDLILFFFIESLEEGDVFVLSFVRFKVNLILQLVIF